MFSEGGVPDTEADALDLSVPGATSDRRRTGAAPAAEGTLEAAPALQLPADRGLAATERLEGWEAAAPTMATPFRRACAANEAEKQVRRGVSTGLPTKATHRGHVWTWDFIADATVRDGALRMLTILDEHTRECHVLRADRPLMLEWL